MRTPIRVIGLTIASCGLMAASCDRQESEYTCITFNQFGHNEMLSNPTAISGWRLEAFPDKPIRIYDPANDNGPQNSKGVLVAGSLRITPFPGMRTYRELMLQYVSDHMEPTRLRLLDPSSMQVDFHQLPASPQNTLLSASITSQQQFAHVFAENESGEVMLSKLCVR